MSRLYSICVVVSLYRTAHMSEIKIYMINIEHLTYEPFCCKCRRPEGHYWFPCETTHEHICLSSCSKATIGLVLKRY